MASYQENGGTNTSSNWQSSSGGTLPFYNQGMQALLGQGQKQAQTPFQAYNNPLVAGATPMQQQAYGQAQGNVGNWQPLTNQAQGALSQLGAAGQFDQSQVQQYLNPYLNGVVGEIGRLGNEQFQNQVLPGLTGNFSALGQQGSARQAMMMSDAAARNQREVLGQQSTALNTGYNNAMQSYLDWAKLNSGNLQSQAAGSASLAGNVQQYGNTDVGTLNTLGGQQQATQQKQLDADYGQFQRQQQYPWEQLNNWGNLFKVGTPTSSSSSGGGSSTSTNTGWSTAFKKGGLAQYAEGGLGEEPEEDIVSREVNRGLNGITPDPNYSTPSNVSALYASMAKDAYDRRIGMIDKLKTNPAFAQKEAPPVMMQLGEALLRGSAQGPGNLGQVLGRSGTAYFDAQRQLDRENQAKASAATTLEERLLPGVKAMAVQSSKMNPLSPEKLNKLYADSAYKNLQIAKNTDFKFPSAEAMYAWVDQQTRKDMETYLSQYATHPLGPRGDAALPGPGSAAPTSAPANVQPAAATQAAGAVTPPPGPVAATPQRGVFFKGEEQGLPSLALKNMTPTQAAAALAKLPEPDRTKAAAALEAATGAKLPVAAGVRNKPLEAGTVKGAEEMYKNYAKQYEDIQIDASAASKELDQIHTLRNIKPNTNMFANTQETIGNLIGALGGDANSPLIQDAVKNRQSNIILSQIMNNSLKAEKGQQTKTDEVRIANEFPKTTDFNKVFDFGLSLAQERAKRRQDRLKFFGDVAGANNGVPVRGQEAWDKEMRQDPLTQYLGGKLVFRSQFIDAFKRRYKDATEAEAVQEWRQMEQDYIARGGRK